MVGVHRPLTLWNDTAETLAPDRQDEALSERVGESRRLHQMSIVRSKSFG
jgi:hypothetical protein